MSGWPLFCCRITACSMKVNPDYTYCLPKMVRKIPIDEQVFDPIY